MTNTREYMKLTSWITYKSPALLLAVALCISGCSASKYTAKADSTKQETFDTPELAAKALLKAAQSKDENEITRVLGPNSKAILHPGDPAAEQAALESFVAKYEKMNRWVTMTDGSKILFIGADNYPFPMPIAQDQSSKWHFKTESGREEIQARRIGKNELLAIDACSAIANAEELYYKKAHEYTPRIFSTPGKHDGLYWETPQGQVASPLGRLKEFIKSPALLASTSDTVEFDGYLFRVLTDDGFAIIARPVKYRDSGVMTFLLSREGVVYQKDLGPDTAAIAGSIKSYAPTKEWTPAE